MPCRTLGEREIVARQCRLDSVADPDLVMQSARALALAQYRNAIAPAFGRVIPQGIIAPHPLSSGIAEPDPDMRPRGKARQIVPVRIDKLVAVDVFGQIGDRADAQLHGPLSAEPGADAKPFRRRFA